MGGSKADRSLRMHISMMLQHHGKQAQRMTPRLNVIMNSLFLSYFSGCETSLANQIRNGKQNWQSCNELKIRYTTAWPDSSVQGDQD